MKQFSVYERIMRASRRGVGLRLSVDDVFRLSMDGAIETRAELDTWKAEHPDDRQDGRD